MTDGVDVEWVAGQLERAVVLADPSLSPELTGGLEEFTGRPLGEGTGPVVHVGPTLPAEFRAGRRSAGDGSEGSDRLMWVHSTNAGVDGMLGDVSPWPEGVLLTRTVGRMGERIGQYVLAWALADCQDVRGFLRQHASRTWRRLPTELAEGRRAVIFGTGSIGAAVAAALRCCGIRTTGVARTPREAPGFDEVFALEAPELTEALGQAHWVVNALPLTPATTGLFGPRLLSAMNGATFVNVGRGESVQTEALAKALETGDVGGAVLDVLPDEPAPPDSPLWDLPNTVITSHSAGITTPTDVLTDFRTAWHALRSGQRPALSVQLGLGY
ncbi:D-2-hydroxyacid dehydrogenase [Streptomyces iconiensis]|uniref:D-2-hydroxyacid dehydrogenase n=1 Tax=Streptomyces iconiensis TaxID=1384038 RepID=A0ABT7A2W9_9ACTN|nr:D-2-hydroxyacid dehydrogenase [Streptomyces iconiensis]MDJ1134968.1 D-2-hydroxyacid dehydrogenase [Streptomyces iconiensis]